MRSPLSTSYWPIAWPPPRPVTLTVRAVSSRLEMPVRPPDEADAALRPFELPEAAPGSRHKPLRPVPFRRTLERDLATDEVVYTLSSDAGRLFGLTGWI